MIHITARVDEMGPASLVTIHAGHNTPHPTPCGLLTMGATEADELVRRIEAGQIPPVDETTLDSKTAAHVLHHYGEVGGMEPGSFTKALITALAAADRTNQIRLARAYPAYALAVHMAAYTLHGITHLQEITGQLTSGGTDA